MIEYKPIKGSQTIMNFTHIVNGNVTNICSIDLPQINMTVNPTPVIYKGTRCLNTTFTSQEIKTFFISNFNQLYHVSYEIITAYPLSKAPLVQSYIITNQHITRDIVQEWINKNSIYNTTPLFKSAYGTFLTGLEYMYLNNEMETYYATN